MPQSTDGWEGEANTERDTCVTSSRLADTVPEQGDTVPGDEEHEQDGTVPDGDDHQRDDGVQVIRMKKNERIAQLHKMHKMHSHQ